jgi:hypothetical protein
MQASAAASGESHWATTPLAGPWLRGLIRAAWMYNRNRKEGIDPYAIFTQIPPA